MLILVMKALNDFISAVDSLKEHPTEQTAFEANRTSRHCFAKFYDLALSRDVCGNYMKIVDGFIETSQRGLRVLKEIAQVRKLEWARLYGHRIASRQERASTFKGGGLEAVNQKLLQEGKVLERYYLRGGKHFPIIVPYDFKGAV